MRYDNASKGASRIFYFEFHCHSHDEFNPQRLLFIFKTLVVQGPERCPMPLVRRPGGSSGGTQSRRHSPVL
jgi:hypothetical protein